MEGALITTLEHICQVAGHPVPMPVEAWGDRLNGWCDAYDVQCPGAELVEVVLKTSVFIFDQKAERVCFAYAISVPALMERNKARLNRSSALNVTVKETLGDRAFKADRGHFLGHASGGALDINLFPHRMELNRPRSPEGKRFRKMEEFVAAHPGTLFYHGALYDDDTWIPNELEYGVLKSDGAWWVERFHNKPPPGASCG